MPQYTPLPIEQARAMRGGRLPDMPLPTPPPAPDIFGGPLDIATGRGLNPRRTSIPGLTIDQVPPERLQGNPIPSPHWTSAASGPPAPANPMVGAQPAGPLMGPFTSEAPLPPTPAAEDLMGPVMGPPAPAMSPAAAGIAGQPPQPPPPNMMAGMTWQGQPQQMPAQLPGPQPGVQATPPTSVQPPPQSDMLYPGMTWQGQPQPMPPPPPAAPPPMPGPMVSSEGRVMGPLEGAASPGARPAVGTEAANQLQQPAASPAAPPLTGLHPTGGQPPPPAPPPPQQPQAYLAGEEGADVIPGGAGDQLQGGQPLPYNPADPHSYGQWMHDEAQPDPMGTWEQVWRGLLGIPRPEAGIDHLQQFGTEQYGPASAFQDRVRGGDQLSLGIQGELAQLGLHQFVPGMVEFKEWQAGLNPQAQAATSRAEADIERQRMIERGEITQQEAQLLSDWKIAEMAAKAQRDVAGTYAASREGIADADRASNKQMEANRLAMEEAALLAEMEQEFDQNERQRITERLTNLRNNLFYQGEVSNSSRMRPFVDEMAGLQGRLDARPAR